MIILKLRDSVQNLNYQIKRLCILSICGIFFNKNRKTDGEIINQFGISKLPDI